MNHLVKTSVGIAEPATTFIGRAWRRLKENLQAVKGCMLFFTSSNRKYLSGV